MTFDLSEGQRRENCRRRKHAILGGDHVRIQKTTEENKIMKKV